MISTPQPASEPASQSWLQRHSRLAAALTVLLAVLLLLIVPPFVSINRYKKHITELVSRSLGRPVRLSSVGWRLLPRPGFVITDLTVEEDPSYGAEPVLHANTVTADVRLWSLWRGHLRLGRISADEASLNLVRAPNGHWNLDSLLRSAGPNASPDAARPPLPYMEASNSRINIKLGAEKLPYSLTDTDASLWQDDGSWHMRLRGQPVRTDVSLNAADTGIVRLEATLHAAQVGQTALRRIPLHIDLDWRAAQLGQLSRLILGDDEDWRGDLTGELHWDGTAEAAKITTRLQASGVHRAEFAPAAQLDFDATCGFLYHYSARSAENVECNSPIGSGRARLSGSVSPNAPQLTLELDRVPAQAPLDLLRTLRGNLDQSLSASGAFSGKMTYAPPAPAPDPPPPSRHGEKGRKAARPAPLAAALQGAFTAQNVRLSGEGLSTAIEIPKISLEPVPAAAVGPPALAASLSVPAGGTAPLAVSARLARGGFAIGIRGSAALDRLRELSVVAGLPQASALSKLSGDPASLDLRLEGPWLATPSGLSGASPIPDEAAKKLTGTIAFRNTQFTPGFLAGPVEISSATLRLEDGLMRWDPVAFTYGPAERAVKGTATATLPAACAPVTVCTPHFTIRFASLSAADLQSALLGAKEQGTLLSTLLDRFRSNSAPNWPLLEGKVEAESLAAGVFTFSAVSADLRVEPRSARITAFTARAFGGQLHGSGSLTVPVRDGKPVYILDASFAGIKPAELGQFLSEKWTGKAISGSGSLTFSGFTAGDFAGSSQGSLNFDWTTGRMSQTAKSPLLSRFTRWTGTARIEKSALTLGENKIRTGSRTAPAEGGISFGPDFRLNVATPRR